MPITHPDLHLTRLDGAIPAWLGGIRPDDLLPVCRSVSDGGGRLVALWGSDAREQNRGFWLHVALVNEAGLICLSMVLDAKQPVYPDISRSCPLTPNASMWARWLITKPTSLTGGGRSRVAISETRKIFR